MSRLETGVIQIRKETADLIQTLGCAVAAVVPAASKKNIVLSVEREDGEGALELPHDKKWTEEAIYNLLDNAVKYTTQGGRVTVRVQRREIFTEIHVRDTGKGIAPERHAQIFTRFYREPEVCGQEGLGIGLYLARQIAAGQGGFLRVRSAPGRGSVFSLYLPRQAVQSYQTVTLPKAP
jgi:signal transduction histidine kinase